MSPSPRSSVSSARASSRSATSSAQPPSISVSPEPSATAYTLTAFSPSVGSGSGIRHTPGATGSAPGSVHVGAAAVRLSLDDTRRLLPTAPT